MNERAKGPAINGRTFGPSIYRAKQTPSPAELSVPWTGLGK